VDFSDLASEADDKWTPEREPWEGVVARAEALCGLLRARKEESIALVTHNDFLQGLLLKSRLQPADDSLRVQFSNAQCVPMVLAWRYLPR
jgi:broad specificity phosphatase PhoE